MIVGSRMIYFVEMATNVATNFFYRPKRSFGRGNIFTSVCQEFCPQEGVLDQAPPRTRQVHPPRTRQLPHPPGPDTTPPDQAGTPPWDQTPPGTRHLPRDQAGPPPGNSRLRNTVNVRPVRILLECILV